MFQTLCLRGFTSPHRIVGNSFVPREEYPLGAKFARFHHAQRFEGAEPVERKVPGRSLFFHVFSV